MTSIKISEELLLEIKKGIYTAIYDEDGLDDRQSEYLLKRIDELLTSTTILSMPSNIDEMRFEEAKKEQDEFLNSFTFDRKFNVIPLEYREPVITDLVEFIAEKEKYYFKGIRVPKLFTKYLSTKTIIEKSKVIVK